MNVDNPLLVCSCGNKVTIRINKRRIIILCEVCDFTFINYRVNRVVEEDNLPKFIVENY